MPKKRLCLDCARQSGIARWKYNILLSQCVLNYHIGIIILEISYCMNYHIGDTNSKQSKSPNKISKGMKSFDLFVSFHLLIRFQWKNVMIELAFLCQFPILAHALDWRVKRPEIKGLHLFGAILLFLMIRLPCSIFIYSPSVTIFTTFWHSPFFIPHRTKWWFEKLYGHFGKNGWKGGAKKLRSTEICASHEISRM